MAGLHTDAVAFTPPTPSGDLPETDKADITETFISDVPFSFPKGHPTENTAVLPRIEQVRHGW
jgi:hypothetical protein